MNSRGLRLKGGRCGATQERVAVAETLGYAPHLRKRIRAAFAEMRLGTLVMSHVPRTCCGTAVLAEPVPPNALWHSASRALVTVNSTLRHRAADHRHRCRQAIKPSRATRPEFRRHHNDSQHQDRRSGRINKQRRAHRRRPTAPKPSTTRACSPPPGIWPHGRAPHPGPTSPPAG